MILQQSTSQKDIKGDINSMNARRREARSKRRAARQISPLSNLPCRELRNPHRSYELLTEEQLDEIHKASIYIYILENIGLDFLDDEALDIWTKAGAKVDRATKHVWLDQGLIMEAMEHAPSTFNWRAHDPSGTRSVYRGKQHHVCSM